MHLWGGKEFDFYSGWGSHHPKITHPYINALSDFFKSFKIPLTVLDLGCGDFNIGKQLIQYVKKYIAIDIVETLIERNKKLYTVNNLEFNCLDISKDKLPHADCVILRQVLQHVSNAEIQNILKKLTSYQYVILTEHIPNGDFIPNKDIIAGQGIRLKHNSGVNILEAPFYFKITRQQILTTYTLEGNNGRIVTTLYELP
ncbi:class I SAM-dependent methyltransferase [Flavobacteriaceae bacterium MHTCC 0001]